MSTYPNWNNDPELLKIGTKNDKIRALKYIFEKHYHDNILKSPEIGNEFYRKRYKSLTEKKIY